MSKVVVVQPRKGRVLGILLVVLVLVLVAGAIALRALGYVRPFYVTTTDMVPAISNGDHVMMETFTFQSRKPKRGDVVVFQSTQTGILLEPGTYIMRIAGEPGETLQIEDGTLVINSKSVGLTNIAGRIHYDLLPEASFLSPNRDSVTVPKGCYFMLGDNTNGSKDSRFWGFLAADKIIGKVSFCYWPSTRIGLVK